MIGSLLIANRGEIACRIIRTARRLGIRTVCVYAEADRHGLPAQLADEAIPLGPSAASESYLAPRKILEAAAQAGVEAIHPGYGFLSENAAFAQAVIDAGLVWVGPSPASIAAMGLKDAAKRLMQEAGVPTTPGYAGENQEPDFLAARAREIGFPVLIKAVAGGGGKGMRRVDAEGEFIDALLACRREAAASFGDDRVLLERYVASPRHIEVQVFGDRHGNVVHLFERDCSVQRRHQKVIEEAPAPGMDPQTRQALCDVAVRAARAVAYEGAGTVEFIADGSEGLRADRIWFMEMNTRLQVEHPVTEEITGVDLVEWQLRVASGEPLPLGQEALSIQGWAMEARLYAEDPARGFLPSTGPLEVLDFGPEPSCRIDTGVAQGAVISPYYDPMIAKVIARGAHREEARLRLRDQLASTVVHPVRTNAHFLVQVLDEPHFIEGRLDTALIERGGEALLEPAAFSKGALQAAAAQMVQASPAPGFRLNAPAKLTGRFLLDGAPLSLELDGNGRASPSASVLVAEAGRAARLSPWRIDGDHAASAGDGAILAPMPGRVIAVEVNEGQSVTRGQKLLTLEAMKMEHTLAAPFDGVVAELRTAAGAQVQVDALLARIVDPNG